MHLAFKFTHAGVRTTEVIVQFAYREVWVVAFAGTMQVAASLLEQAIIKSTIHCTFYNCYYGKL